MRIDQAKELVRKHRDDLVGLTIDLVRTPTENRIPDGTEAAGQRVLKQFFQSTPVEFDEFEPDAVAGAVDHPDWWPGRNYKGRPNLVVTRRATGSGGRSLVFNGHMDTVTSAPLPWPSGDPFSGRVDNGRLYGRGSYDMKAGVAACATVIKILVDHNIETRGDVLLQSVVDEENAGANGTLAAILRGHTGDLAIIPEPTNLAVCPETRGGQVFELVASGKGGVAYAGETVVNPIVTLAEAIARLRDYEVSINKGPHPGLYAVESHPRDLVFSKLSAGDRPGGNIGIPVAASAEFFIQTLPGMTEQQLHDELRSWLGKLLVEDSETGLRLVPTSRYLSGAATPQDHPGVQLLLSALGDATGVASRAAGATFGGDGYLFNKWSSTPSVHLGPKGGNAHGQDEFVELDSLFTLTETLLLAAVRWSS
jgi:acetylornithine deacetylase